MIRCPKKKIPVKIVPYSPATFTDHNHISGTCECGKPKAGAKHKLLSNKTASKHLRQVC
jgi:hypothetical protein